MLRNHFPDLYSALRGREQFSPDLKNYVNHKDIVVFVYGTLKRDHSNYAFLSECKYLGEAITVMSDYCMYDTGQYYPIVSNTKVNVEHKGHVLGEAFAVPPHKLASLDVSEGNPKIMQRVTTWITLKNQMHEKSQSNPVVSAIMYVGTPSVMYTRMNRSFTRQSPEDKLNYFYKWYRVHERKNAIDKEM